MNGQVKPAEKKCVACHGTRWMIMTTGNDSAPNGMEAVKAACIICNPDGKAPYEPQKREVA